MRVLGIDPGLTRCGLGVIEVGLRGTLELIDVRVTRSSPAQVAEYRVHEIAAVIARHVEEFRPDVVAIERVFSQHNVSTVMGIAHISGAVMYIAGEKGIPVILYTPTQVKAAVSGYGGADKTQVQNMVKRVLKLDSAPKPADAADALAIAICHAWNSAGNSARIVGGTETQAQRMWREAESRTGRRT